MKVGTLICGCDFTHTKEMCLITNQTAAVPRTWEAQKWNFLCEFTLKVLICPRFPEEGLPAFPGFSAGGRWTLSRSFWVKLTGEFSMEKINEWRLKAEAKQACSKQPHQHEHRKRNKATFIQ